MERRGFFKGLLASSLVVLGFRNSEVAVQTKRLLNKLDERSFFKLVPVEFEDLRKDDVFVSVDPPGGWDKGEYFNEVSRECYNSADPGKKPQPTMLIHRRETLVELFERKEA